MDNSFKTNERGSKKRLKQPCTSCGKFIVSLKDARKHPVLETIQCITCHSAYLLTGDLSKYRGGIELNGQDNYCRWCLDGGDLVICADESCRSQFCYSCIERNFDLKRLKEITGDKSWYCFVCDYTQIEDLQISAKQLIKLPVIVCAQPKKILQKEMVQITSKKAQIFPIMDISSETSLEQSKINSPEQLVVEPDLPLSAQTDDITREPSPEQPVEMSPARSPDSPVEILPVSSPDHSVKMPPTPSPDEPIEMVLEPSLDHSIEIPSANSPEHLTQLPMDRSPEQQAVKLRVPSQKKPTEKSDEAPSDKPIESQSVSLPEISENEFLKSALTKDLPKTPLTKTKSVSFRVPPETSKSLPYKDPTKMATTPKRKVSISDKIAENLKAQKQQNKSLINLHLFSSSKLFDRDREESKVVDPVVEKPQESPSPQENINLSESNNSMDLEDELYISDDSDNYNTPIGSPDISSVPMEVDISQITTNGTAPMPELIKGWAIKDAYLLNRRIEILKEALSSVNTNYSEEDFKGDTQNLTGWLSNIEAYLKAVPHIKDRCQNIMKLMSMTDE